MTPQEYEAKQKALLNEYEANRRKLAFDYAVFNNQYNVGDIITDHYHSIRITGWQLYSVSEAQLLYKGIELKKDGTPTKAQKDTTIFQSNVKSHIPQ